MNLFFIYTSVILGAIGQLLLKSGALKINNSPLVGIHQFINILIFLGFLFYGLSSIIWVVVLRKVELSYAYPMISFGYIIVFGASYFLFNESLNLYRLIGLGFILVGILFVAKS